VYRVTLNFMKKTGAQHPLYEAENKPQILAVHHRIIDAMATRQPPSPQTLAAFRALGFGAPPKPQTFLRGRSQTLLQAVDGSPSLSHLAALTHDSQLRLKAITPLLPNSMRNLVQAGPIEGNTWCLLVPNSAILAKLRQMLPALCAHLRTKGWDVQEIRLKVMRR
jgi:hypothetical protein